MDTKGLIHRIGWTPASLSIEPLRFGKVVFLVDDDGRNEALSGYREQLSNEGYLTEVVNNTADVRPWLTDDNIVVYIPPASKGMSDVYETSVRSCACLVTAAQIIHQHNRSDKSKRCKLFSVVTKDFGVGDLHRAPLSGLARVLKMEVPDTFGGLFEESQGLFPLSAIRFAQGLDVVRVSEGLAQTASLQPFQDEPGEGRSKELHPKADATYLITGGTRGMGLEIATWMAGRGARSIILVARRGLQPASDGKFQDAEMGKLSSRITELKAQGVTVHVLGIDLGKRGADSTLSQAIENLHVPRIRGVVHAAGIAGYHTLERCTADEMASVFAPKVMGALNVDALFPPGTLDFFVLTSSIGQLVGFPGQLSYAPSNAFLDELSEQRRRQGDNSTSIQWTSWRGVGLMAQNKSAERMIKKGMQSRGIADVSKEEAFAAWDRITSLKAGHVAVVRALELEPNETLRHPILKEITPRKPEGTKSGRTTFNKYPDHAVAVVGLACRTAAGDTAEDFWDVIQAGKSMEREIDLKRFPEAASKGKMWGNFISGVESFDNQFFKKSKRESSALDPHQRVLLETTYHALESASCLGSGGEGRGEGLQPETHDKSGNSHVTGCFIGMNAPDYPLNLACHPPSPYTGFGMLRSFVAGRLSHHFGWTGPSHTVDTACSSAMVAVHQACRAIETGECTRAVAGGVNLITNTALFDALRTGGFLNETGACKTFDERADGYCRGEAAGVVVLKKLDRALSDGDDIQGVLLATGNNQNINNTSITNPVLESQSALYRDVLARAEVSGRDVSYVEAHGTGTRAGDPVEAEGIRQVLGGSDRLSILHMGAVKPNIGHSEGASGILSLIKVLLMLKHGKITPQAHFRTLNPNIPALEPDMMAISKSLVNWDDESRLALVNSYGASGNNAAAVVGPPPPSAPVEAAIPIASTFARPVLISAASKASLLAYCNRLGNHIDRGQMTPEMFPHLAFALAKKQNRQLQHMFCTTATSLSDLRTQLSDPEKHYMTSQKPKPVVLLFSGQNGDTVPSARPLYENSLLFQKHLHQCDKEMQSLGLPSLFPAVLEGIQGGTDLVLRHAAMFRRASIIQKLWGDDTGSMVAIEADLVDTHTTAAAHLQPFCEKYPHTKVDIACYNGPNNYVAAGSTTDIEILESYLTKKKSSGEKLRFKVLKGMHAYHTVLADSIVDESAKLSSSIPFQDPIFPFESCHQDPWTGPGTNVIARNTRGAVYFTQAISRIVNRLGACTFLEAGVGGPIVAMARSALPQAQAKYQHTFVASNAKDPMRSLADATAALWSSSGQLNAEFWPFHRDQWASYVPVDLPPYQFERNRHWLEYTGLSRDGGGVKTTGGEQVAHQASGCCPHCLKEMSDFPYIVAQDNNPRDLAGGKPASFKIDPRSKRYVDIVRGHAVVGVPICPAGMYLELASHGVALLREAQGRKETSLPAIMAEDLEIKAPLGLDTQRSIMLTLTGEKEGVWRFELSSTKEKGKSLSHATGRVSLRDDGGSRAKYESNEKDGWARAGSLLDRDADAEGLHGAVLYRVFSSMAKYSSAYRGLRHLVGKGPEGAGDIGMPADDTAAVAKTPNGNIADPLVMDNFLQVPGAYVHSLRTAPEDEGDADLAYICTGIGSAGPLSGLQGSGEYRAYTKVVREDKKEALLDIFAFDKQNRKMIWSARGLKFTRVPRDSLAKALAKANPEKGSKTQLIGEPKSIVHIPTPQKTTIPVASPTKPRKDEKSAGVLSGVQDLLSKSLDVPVDEVVKHATLEELGTDSLVTSEILANISGKFKVDISTGEFASVTDVISLVELISSRLGVDLAGTSDDEKEDQEADSLSDAAYDTTSEGLKTLFEILSGSLDVPTEDIKMDSQLEELGVDSLVAAEIISNLNDAFKVDISSAEFTSTADVSSLFNLVSGNSTDESVQTSADISSSTSHAHTPSSANTGSSSPVRGESADPIKPGSGSMHEAFLQTRRRFDSHAKDTRFAGYWDQVYPRQLNAVTAFIVEAFEKLDCPIGKFKKGDKLPSLRQTLPKFHREVPRLWQILEEASIVEKSGDAWLRGPVPLHTNVGGKSAEELSTELISDFPQFASTHGLPGLLGPQLAEYLTGEADPISLLFGTPKGRSLLEDFYANGPDLRAATQVLCDFVATAIRSSQASRGGGEPFRVLEIGAGTGGTTKHLVPVLQAAGLPFAYTFTELSPSLLAQARRAPAFRGVEGLEFRKLNIEQEAPAELRGRYDLVVSSNCVHATRDLRCCLTNARQLLRPGGCLALVELTQKLPWYDLVWGLLDGWWLFDDGRDYALQSPWAWERAMRDSGFAHVEWSEGASRESRSVRVICAYGTEAADESPLEKTCPSRATSILLHRGARAPGVPGARSLFLAPDGNGSGAVFGALSPLLGSVKEVSVYALNSPFLKNKSIVDQQLPTIEELAATYVAEIKRRQPDGPYLLGGYSIGGVVAYEAARQLLEHGDHVKKLFLIDTACPSFATCMPGALFDFLGSLPPVGMVNGDGIRGQNSRPSIVTDHFVLSGQLLQLYKVSKLPGGQMPHAVLLSAREGVDKQSKIPRPEVPPEEQPVVDWFLDDRTDDGPLGWDEYLGSVDVVRAAGNHFSLMTAPEIDSWAPKLAELLDA